MLRDKFDVFKFTSFAFGTRHMRTTPLVARPPTVTRRGAARHVTRAICCNPKERWTSRRGQRHADHHTQGGGTSASSRQGARAQPTPRRLSFAPNRRNSRRSRTTRIRIARGRRVRAPALGRVIAGPKTALAPARVAQARTHSPSGAMVRADHRGGRHDRRSTRVARKISGNPATR